MIDSAAHGKNEHTRQFHSVSEYECLLCQREDPERRLISELNGQASQILICELNSKIRYFQSV